MKISKMEKGFFMIFLDTEFKIMEKVLEYLGIFFIEKWKCILLIFPILTTIQARNKDGSWFICTTCLHFIISTLF